MHGDGQSEAFLSEIVGAQSWPDKRHWNMESIYEYGARAGFWRIHDLFVGANIPLTIYGVATALARSPDQLAAMQQAGWEIASHGYKWIEDKDFSKTEEEEHIKKAIALHEQVLAVRRRIPGALFHAYGGSGLCNRPIDYISDSYADDLPY